MREFGVKFLFEKKSDNPISEDILYQLRSEVSLHLEHSGFGAHQECGDGSQFRNEFATPAIDHYDPTDNELYITYYWPWPLRHGNLTTLFTQCVPELQDYAKRMGTKLTFRSIFT